jgi:hypothetical protein
MSLGRCFVVVWMTSLLVGFATTNTMASTGVVSRIPDSIEAFWVREDGSLWDIHWYDAQPWKPFELAPAGSAHTSSRPAAVSRKPDTIEVFWVGQNGSVEDANWYASGTWHRGQLAPRDSAAVEAGLAALAHRQDALDLFWISNDGSVRWASWREGGQWRQEQLAPAGSASTKGGIAAVARQPGTIEIFWIGPNGSIEDAHWYEGHAWSRFQLAPPGSASTTGAVAVVSRIPTSIELWWIGNEGSIEDAHWYEGGNWQRFQLAPKGAATVSGEIAAVSRKPETMEIFFTGSEGSIEDAHWYAGSSWRRFTLAPPGSASTANDGFIATVDRLPITMEVLYRGADGSLRNAFWYEGTQWYHAHLAAPLRLDPSDCWAGAEKDGAFCYPRCRAGFSGAGPMCWGQCPAGFTNDGATCRRDLHIIARDSYGRGPGFLTRSDYRGIFERHIRDHRNIWLARGSPLSAAERASLSAFFPHRIVDGMRVFEMEGMTGAFIFNADATTYGPEFVTIKKGSRNTNLLKHELVHACQYDRLGVDGFARAYADQYVDSGYDYNQIPFERQAFQYASRAVSIKDHLGYCE